MNADCITYFGYGSLVNRATRPAIEVAYPARLYGWQRVWGHRVLSAQQPCDELARSCCSLSVQKLINIDSSHRETVPFIEGVVVSIPISELPILDKREAGYERHVIPCDQFELPTECSVDHIHVYVSKLANQGCATEDFPILQSYVDCVLAGYCEVFEPMGMQRFVDSTKGWDGVIENERDKPKYPRAVSLPVRQLAQFDRIVAEHRLNMEKETL